MVSGIQQVHAVEDFETKVKGLKKAELSEQVLSDGAPGEISADF